MESRDLDRMIAEKVMGWTRISKDHQWNYALSTHCYGWPDEWYGAPPGEPDGNANVNWTLVPAYSTEIGPAWRLVEKLGMFTLENGGASVGEPEWCASFTRRGTTEPVWVSDHADTAARAICLAALKAVGD